MNRARLTFSLGDLLGSPRIPPCLLKDPCEVCAQKESVTTIQTDSKSFQGYESVQACQSCADKFRNEMIRELEEFGNEKG